MCLLVPHGFFIPQKIQYKLFNFLVAACQCLLVIWGFLWKSFESYPQPKAWLGLDQIYPLKLTHE
jgi:hypothetical protein